MCLFSIHRLLLVAANAPLLRTYVKLDCKSAGHSPISEEIRNTARDVAQHVLRSQILGNVKN